MSQDSARSKLRRLLNPRNIAVVGGEVAGEVIRQCRKVGFAGQIWPVNPRRNQIEGLTTFACVADLPGVPDATFIAVPREDTIAVVAALAARGAAGAVCYASGFAEVGGEGVVMQQRLVSAAGDMALLGPNCYGLVNYLEGCALWPDLQGGERVERGVAVLTQSGNIALNFTMQRRHLPIAFVIAVGNKAVSDIHDCIEALLDDPRVSAIGLHLEGLGDVAAFARSAALALQRGIPMVVIKTGASEIGAQLASSHTSSLAGPDQLYSALFQRLGIARVGDLDDFLETLKLLHTCGPLAGQRVASLSCSGGDASLVADIGTAQGLSFPQLSQETAAALAETLGPMVPLNNPLDYQTYIWGDEVALEACFTAMLRSDPDVSMVVLDFPHTGTDRAPGWDEVAQAFLAAHARLGGPAILVSSMAELLPARVARQLLAAGIAPMQGLRSCAVAIAAAAAVGGRRAASANMLGLSRTPPLRPGMVHSLDELAAKSALAAFGVPVPNSARVHTAQQAVAAATSIGYPVVIKAIGEQLAHKTELDAVRLNLASPGAVEHAARELGARFGTLFVEAMVSDGLVELIIGVTRDPRFGLALTLGAGGVLVELLADSATLLFPVTRSDVRQALCGLRCFPLLAGFRGRPSADIEPVLDAVLAIAAYAETNADALVELDVNPLIVSASRVTAVDALIRVVAAPE